MVSPDIFHDYGWSEKGEQEGAKLPVMVYDEEHLDQWMQLVEKQGGAKEHTLITIHAVSGDPAPVRWLANIIDGARVWEGLKEAGIEPPQTWKLMAPVHVNTGCNNGDIDAAMDNAVRLHNVAIGYLKTFHPSVPTPELETDEPSWVANLRKRGSALYPILPDRVRSELGGMSGKHANGDAGMSAAASYLLAHYEAYGRLDGTSLGGFASRKNAIFVVPQSEDRFIQLMDSSEASLRAIGFNPVPPTRGGNIIMVSQHLRSPHYYAHIGEPLLGDIVSPHQWPTVNQLAHRKGLNGVARNEIIGAIAYIEEDIGGKQNIGILTDIINGAF